MLQAIYDGGQCFTQALDLLNQAVNGLRQAEVQEFITRGLLARAELYRICYQFDLGKHDLNEAFSIAERCGMNLYQADCHLEYARVLLLEKRIRRERALK